MIVVSRADWGARPPTRTPVNIPASSRRGLVVHWNGPPLRTSGPGDEQAKLRGIQRYHQSTQRWPDAAYSYAVGNSGNVYELRGGWNQFANGDDDVGADDGPDSRWFTVLWLGGAGETPTPAAYASLVELVGSLRRSGAGPRVLPHSDFKPKTCPGPDLTAWCRSMDSQEADDMTPQQAQQLDQVWQAMFAGLGGGPLVERVRQIHELERAVRCEGGAGGSLSDADIDRVAVRVADLLARRLGS